jgi:hypothetical protein
MNIKKFTLAISAACALVTSLHADTTYYIAGSTAYRKATYAAIKALYQAAGNSLDANYPIGDSSSTATGSGATVNTVANGSANLIWSGSLANQGLGHVVIVCNWSGSISGQKANAENAVWPTFLDPATVAPAEVFIGQKPDLNVSDNFQKTTIYTAALDPGAQDLKRTAVAVITFIVAKDPKAPAGLNDVNSKNLKKMYGDGFMILSQLTGNSADSTSYVLPTGRDDDSGTRTIFEADNGIGFTDTILQWGLHSPSVDGSVGYTPFQFGLVSINASDGNGYASGGTVGTLLADATGPATIVNPKTGSGNVTAYFVGYISVTDATGSGIMGQALNYNGVPYSDAAVKEGEYTYWGYENVDVKNGRYVAADLKPIYDALVNGMKAQAGSLAGTIDQTLTTSMHCSRLADGGPITHL